MTSVVPSGIVLDGRLDPDSVVAVARDGVPVRLDDTAAARNAAAHATVGELIARGRLIYGRTTGVGALKEQMIDGAGRPGHGLRLLRSHAGGTGPPLDADIGRAAMVVRLNQLGAGGAGVSAPLLTALTAALRAGLAPCARALGAVGTGDLGVLAELGLALAGERPWLGEGNRPDPVPVTDVDALAFMSSNAVTLGQGCLAWRDARTLLRGADAVAALSFEALRGNPQAYDPRVTHHPGEAAVAARMLELLGTGHRPSARLQDPLSLRCVPQIHGAARDALELVEGILTVEVNAAAENPLVSHGEVLHHGGFQLVRLALAVGQMRSALAHVAGMAARRLSLLCDPVWTGLPVFLAAGPAGSSGVLALEYIAQAAVAEVRAAAGLAEAGGSVISLGVEDHASFATQGVAAATRMLPPLSVVLAAELVTAVRALRMRSQPPEGAGTRRLLDGVTDHLPEALEDRPLTEDVDQAATLLAGGLVGSVSAEP